MRSHEYHCLATRAGELSDEFYRCVSEWARKSTSAAADECLKTAQEYRNALEEQIRYLKTRARTGPRDEAITSCETYLQMLERQLNVLRKGKNGH